MKNHLKIALLFSAIMLNGCGFEPLYAEKENKGSILIGSSFKIDKIDFGRPGQKLQYRLEDMLNHGTTGAKKYRMAVRLEKTKEGLGIQKDRLITRYNIRVRAVYEIFETASGRKLFSGVSNMVGGFDAVMSEFGTYSLEENTTLRLMDELAKDIVLNVATKLSDTQSVEKLAAEQEALEREPALKKSGK